MNEAMTKVSQAKEDIRLSQEEIDKLQPLLQNARSIAEGRYYTTLISAKGGYKSIQNFWLGAG